MKGLLQAVLTEEDTAAIDAFAERLFAAGLGALEPLHVEVGEAVTPDARGAGDVLPHGYACTAPLSTLRQNDAAPTATDGRPAGWGSRQWVSGGASAVVNEARPRGDE